ncbi:hypothetical protein JW877_00415 [bacterium]|nr:hypothetical protein [bacterium]
MKSPKFFISIMLLLTLLIIPAEAFKPALPPNAPKIWLEYFSPETQVEFTFLYLHVEIKDSNALVHMDLYLHGTLMDSMYINFFNRTRETDFFINGTRYKYSYQSEKLLYYSYYDDVIKISTSYNMPLRYTFSGPPGPWKKGYLLELSGPLVENEIHGNPIMPKSMLVSVQAPKDYQFQGEAKIWSIREDADFYYYTMQNQIGLKMASRWEKLNLD